MFNIDDVVINGSDDFTPGSCQTTAYLNGKQVGFITFYAVAGVNENDITEVNPHVAHIQPEYQRTGIGTKIIKEVSRNYRVRFLNASNNVCEDKDDIHYTDEGLSFMNHCCELGIATNDLETEAQTLIDDYYAVDNADRL